MLITVTEGAEHRLVWRNRLAVELYGEREAGEPLARLFPESAGVLELWDRAFGGETVTASSATVAPLDVAGRRRVMRYSLGDAEDALRAFTDALVPEVADLAAIYVFDLPAVETARAFAPVALARSAGIRRAGPPPLSPRRARLSRWDGLLDAGEPVAIGLDTSTIAELDPHPDMCSWLQRVDATSLALAPLTVSGERAGAVLLLGVGSRRRYDEGDVDFLRAVTARAGSSIAELRSRTRDRQAAQRLQRSLLPSRPPALTEARVAARYLPASSHYPVGGDWWDVLELGDNALAFAIGDISGHGLGAAALMGQARVAMRTAARAGLAPARVLALVDDQLAAAIADQDDADIDLHRFATGLYAVTDPGRAHLRVASAGHLPLLVRPAHGRTRPAWTPADPPLGLGAGTYHETVVPLRPGDTIVAYTDGLIEDRQLPTSDGIDRLAAVIDDAAQDDDLEAVAAAIVTRMGRGEAANDDDIALLVLRLDGADP